MWVRPREGAPAALMVSVRRLRLYVVRFHMFVHFKVFLCPAFVFLRGTL